MDWWALFRTATLLHLLSSAARSAAQNDKCSSDSQGNITNSFMDVIGLQRVCPPSQPSPGEWRRPICKTKVGCDIPLNCYDYSLKEKGALKVTPHNLEAILENPSITNTCAVVMFYAPWCPYSVDFARQFNALGRSYSELSFLAVDFNENDLYKYLTAYIPLVSFYYRGKVIYRFKATESYEELLEQVSMMTNFQPTRVELSDVENEFPVPTVRTDVDTPYLVMVTLWVLFVVTVYVCRTKTVSDWTFRMFHRTKED